MWPVVSKESSSWGAGSGWRVGVAPRQGVRRQAQVLSLPSDEAGFQKDQGRWGPAVLS